MLASEKPYGLWQTVCQYTDLVPGEFVEFQIEQAEPDPDTLPLTGFLFLDGQTLRAYINQCPHMGVELNWMPGRFMDIDNLFIQCSTHGALFKPGSGECIAGPCQGEALTALEARINCGAVQVRLAD
jgi:nitrite reductase/ring-hydroxylating ferredoxin subunit